MPTRRTPVYCALQRMVALSLAVMAGCAGSLSTPAHLVPTNAPDAAVNLSLPRQGGGVVSFAELRGSPVVVTLFATWCLRCQAEAARFAQLDEQWRPRGVHVVGIALDLDATALLGTYVRFEGLDFPIAVAAADDSALIRAFGRTRAIPRTLLLDRKGHIVQDHAGGQTDFEGLAEGLRGLF